MNQKPDRDRTIDRLLAGAMSRGSDDAAGGPVPPKLVVGGPSDGGCLDADTLAAWADDALDAVARTAAEAHAADCARCQAMLAAMARTASPAPVGAAAPWWKPALRWVVPLTAAAAAVLVWAIVPERNGRVNVRQVSQNAEPSALPSASSPSSPNEPAAAAAESTPAGSPAARRETQTLAQAKDVDLSRQSADSAKADLSRRSAAGPAEGAKPEGATAEGANANAADKKNPPPAGALADASARNAELRVDRARAANERAAAAPAAPPQPMAKTFSFGAPETVIVSSNPASRWRILQGGEVQRSADGGATWQTQTTGVSETLSGGSSPLPSVCWLVGPKGIVLRTTDGRSWSRVRFPEVVPLASIRATDADSAVVTTGDGRQFATEDGGRTWTPKEF